MAALWRSQVSGGAAIWSPSNGGGGAVQPPAPTLVEGSATGATTAAITVTNSGGSGASHRVQVRTVGGVYADAVGSTNPMPPGVLVFYATGRPGSLQQEAQVRAENGLTSAYVTSATWWQDVAVGGGGQLPDDIVAPTLAGAIEITGLTPTGYLATVPVATGDPTGYQWRLGGVGNYTDIPAGGRSRLFTARTPGGADVWEMVARDDARNVSAALVAVIDLPPLPVPVLTEFVRLGSPISILISVSSRIDLELA